MNVVRVLSVSVGQPREVVAGDRVVRTSIFKCAVIGRIPIRNNNLAGDAQSDLSVHGGPAKAVYAYPHEHYAFWREQLPGVDLQPGHFGENLTIEGLLEQDVHLGDRLAIGSAQLVVTQPRLPCYKLGIRFGRDDMAKRFLASGRTGFYMSVAVEGDIGAGDTIDRIEPVGRGVRLQPDPLAQSVRGVRLQPDPLAQPVRGVRLQPDPTPISIPELLSMYLNEGTSPERLREAIAQPALSDAWRRDLQKQLAER